MHGYQAAEAEHLSHHHHHYTEQQEACTLNLTHTIIYLHEQNSITKKEIKEGSDRRSNTRTYFDLLNIQNYAT